MLVKEELCITLADQGQISYAIMPPISNVQENCSVLVARKLSLDLID